MSRLAKHDKTLSLLVLILSVFSIASFFFLSSSPTSAESRSASVTVGSACTLSAVENTAHTATIPSGTNQSDIGRTTFSMVCNDSGGFSIYAIGYGSNELGNTKLIASINGSAAPSYDINTGSNASGTPSSWAMKLTPGTNLTSSNILNGYGSYSVIPSSYTKVATLVPSTAVTNTSTLEATYRVNVASTQPAGNYNGKVRYVMVNPNTNVPNEPKTCDAGKICYWPNAGNEVTDSMGDQTLTELEGKDQSQCFFGEDNAYHCPALDDMPDNGYYTTKLWASNFRRPGYGFAGWNTEYDYSGTNYGPNETFVTENGGVSFYAIWVQSSGNLQNWTGCSGLSIGQVTALTDLRDNDTYAVAKLADGNCWMIENLRLDYDALNNSDGILAEGYGGAFAGLAQPETSLFWSTLPTAANHATNSLYSSDGSTSISIGGSDYPAYRMPRYNNNNTNTNSSVNPNMNISNMTDIDQNVYSYGNYYNFAAGLANTNHYSSISSVDSNGFTSETSPTSICPSGWMLPYGRTTGNGATSGGYHALNQAIENGYIANEEAGKRIRAYPNNFVYSGVLNNNSIQLRGVMGAYLTPSVWSNYTAYYFNAMYASPGSSNYSKYVGMAVRCVMNS